jgi:thioredoxin 1
MKLWRACLTVLTGILLLSGCSQASDVDGVLAQAKKDGKVVMLELGSVGCIPCEQMKPVMDKLRTSYKDRMEVYFVDVKKDNAGGRRFGVYLIPTQVFLDKNGKEFHRHVGFYAYDEITAVLIKAGL